MDMEKVVGVNCVCDLQMVKGSDVLSIHRKIERVTDYVSRLTHPHNETCYPRFAKRARFAADWQRTHTFSERVMQDISCGSSNKEVECLMKTSPLLKHAYICYQLPVV